jgi:hypothetical protein
VDGPPKRIALIAFKEQPAEAALPGCVAMGMAYRLIPVRHEAKQVTKGGTGTATLPIENRQVRTGSEDIPHGKITML